MNELDKLKKKAKKLYSKVQASTDMDCGRSLAEYIRPGLGVARQEFNEVWDKIMELDPSAPPDPFR